MVKIINSWAQGIVVAIIIATIIEILLPEGNNKKYLKVILGLYILFSIVYPAVNSISKGNINFNSILNNTNKEMERYKGNYVSIETNAYIETTYKNTLKEDINNTLKEKGYKVLNLNIYIETQNQENYGQINSIVMNLESKSKNMNKITNEIEEVKINISNTNTDIQSEKLSTDEINNLKEYFENSYSIEKEKVHINE